MLADVEATVMLQDGRSASRGRSPSATSSWSVGTRTRTSTRTSGISGSRPREDTANIAARLEANGLTDEIQVSDNAYRRLRDRYRFSDGHVIDLKGVGPTPARFLIERNGSR